MYLLIERIDREIGIEEFASLAEAKRTLIDHFIEFNEPYLTKKQIKMLNRGKFPKFDDCEADICDSCSWSNMRSSTYDCMIYEVKGVNPITSDKQPSEACAS